MRALVTGAASGFGRAVVDRLRSTGYRVRGLDITSTPGVVLADVRDQEGVAAAVTSIVDELGGLDVLINNAGIGEPQDSGAPPDERSAAILETNFLGAWRVTSAALPALLRSGGRVVNIASGLAFVTLPYAAAYTASKRALAAYSDVLRLEYGDRITVTTVYPGYVETPIHRASEEMGVSLRDALPAEPIDRVVRTIVRAATGRARRDMTTGPLTALGVLCARHAPRLADRVVSMRVRNLHDRKEWSMGGIRR